MQSCLWLHQYKWFELSKNWKFSSLSIFRKHKLATKWQTMQDIVCHFVPVPSLEKLVRLLSISLKSSYQFWRVLISTKSTWLWCYWKAKGLYKTILAFLVLYILKIRKNWDNPVQNSSVKRMYRFFLPCRVTIEHILLHNFAWKVDSWGFQMGQYHPWLVWAAICRAKFLGFF